MMNSGKWKLWVTSFTAFTFAVAGTTGLMMFFHIRVPFIKEFHEWIGVAMAVCGVLHLIIHWKTFCGYLKRWEAMVALAGVVMALVFLAFAGEGEGPHDGHGGPHGRMGIQQHVAE